MIIWLVWAQHYDKSGDIQFLRAYRRKEDVLQLQNMIERTNPSMQVNIDQIWLDAK